VAVAVSNFGKEEFQKMLIMWGEASAGSGCNLNYSSGHSGRSAIFDVVVVDEIELAMRRLRSSEPDLFELLKFRYVCYESPRPKLDLQFKFKISERKVSQLLDEAEHLVRGFYLNNLDAA
jgi:hypothetical protein